MEMFGGVCRMIFYITDGTEEVPVIVYPLSKYKWIDLDGMILVHPNYIEEFKKKNRV
jgi:hypothetical protein